MPRRPSLLTVTIGSLLAMPLNHWLFGTPWDDMVSRLPFVIAAVYLTLALWYWLPWRPTFRLRGVPDLDRVLHGLESGERYAADICRVYGVSLGHFYGRQLYWALMDYITVTREPSGRRAYAMGEHGRRYAEASRAASPQLWRRMDALRRNSEAP